MLVKTCSGDKTARVLVFQTADGFGAALGDPELECSTEPKPQHPPYNMSGTLVLCTVASPEQLLLFEDVARGNVGYSTVALLNVTIAQLREASAAIVTFPLMIGSGVGAILCGLTFLFLHWEKRWLWKRFSRIRP